MHYKESAKILKVAYDKIIDERLWQRWLIDIQGMDKDTWVGFEDYKAKLLDYAKLKSRTKEERKADFKEAQMVAEMAFKKLNPKNDLGILPEKKKV